MSFWLFSETTKPVVCDKNPSINVSEVDNDKQAQSKTAELASVEDVTSTVEYDMQQVVAEAHNKDTAHTESILNSEEPASSVETLPAVETSGDGKTEVWDTADNADGPLPTVTNVTLTNLTEFAPQDPNATPINLENCVYGLAPAPIMTSLGSQQLRPITNQFGANTTTLFAAGNYPHIITTPTQAGLQGFAAAG